MGRKEDLWGYPLTEEAPLRSPGGEDVAYPAAAVPHPSSSLRWGKVWCQLWHLGTAVFASVVECWSTLMSDCIRSGVRRSSAIVSVRIVGWFSSRSWSLGRCTQHADCSIRRLVLEEARARSVAIVLVEYHLAVESIDDLPF